MKYKMYGITNCDTVKKARQALEKKKIDYDFVDFKKTAPTVEDLKRWEKVFGDLPANKKGPTFRKIKDEFEAASRSEQINLLLKNSSAIKRPILESGSKVLCFGFDEDLYKKL
ncbi:arsenate reductase family protein [Pseudobdellovibrio sp. HCB154]|uniref:arsenate reductase family protein n=1 Tax=Pseudobdellovibrio sp. HCB154 TaxID=3386277 RepID=UPI0039173C43